MFRKLFEWLLVVWKFVPIHTMSRQLTDIVHSLAVTNQHKLLLNHPMVSLEELLNYYNWYFYWIYVRDLFLLQQTDVIFLRCREFHVYNLFPLYNCYTNINYQLLCSTNTYNGIFSQFFYFKTFERYLKMLNMKGNMCRNISSKEMLWSIMVI